VALTFDDGPHPQGTPGVLDFLSARGLQATFFLVGEQVVRRPALAFEIAARGHEIGLHCYEHRMLIRLTAGEAREDLKRAVHVISSATGNVPKFYRPPRGVLTYQALRAIAGQGWHPVLWAADGRDWRSSATSGSICRRVTGRLRGGEVILLHDADYYSSAGSWRNTLAALPLILRTLETKGLRIIPLASGYDEGKEC
jgi:peptidoglycan/xylan/chitin deacetylase (PgdA/CDA1 family)